jgi:Type IV secretion-system coupling protein DNA-binding domain
MRVFLGTLERNAEITIELSAASRMRHAAVFGKSGVGKTTLLRNMIVADLCSGVGLTVADPHGGLIDSLPSAIPRSRTNDVIYFNPADRTRVLGLNVLESVNRHERHLVVSSAKSIIHHAWPDFWGPRLEWILEHALAALLDSAEPVTLLGLPKLLTDSAYRAHILKRVSDPALLDFFRLYDAQNDRFRQFKESQRSDQTSQRRYSGRSTCAREGWLCPRGSRYHRSFNRTPRGPVSDD